MSLIYIIILSVLFAISLKITDSLNEHDLKLFKGAKILFGILWGIIGALLILSNNLLSNLWLAVLIGWIFRAKIDNLGHGIGTSIILVVFILNLINFQLEQTIFLTFFSGIIVIGSIHDYLTYSKKVNRRFSELFHSVFYFTLLPLIYSIVSKQWIIFASFFSFIIGYEITRLYSSKKW